MRGGGRRCSRGRGRPRGTKDGRVCVDVGGCGRENEKKDHPGESEAKNKADEAA